MESSSFLLYVVLWKSPSIGIGNDMTIQFNWATTWKVWTHQQNLTAHVKVSQRIDNKKITRRLVLLGKYSYYYERWFVMIVWSVVTCATQKIRRVCQRNKEYTSTGFSITVQRKNRKTGSKTEINNREHYMWC